MNQRLPTILAASLVLLELAWGSLSAPAAETETRGRRIFQKHCARCHGKNGEGVTGKFDGPLQGDRPLEKLARYIERTMPDDDPGKCVGEDAAAVARYIHGAFYSAEARQRKNPARVQLVHLTNRQYLNTIADLLRQLDGGRDEALSAERGLRASYHAAKDANRDNLVLERVDRQVEFDFDAAPPHERLMGTNGFNIQWRGALLAPETGDYEFIVRTPNGMRLYVNDPEEPLIDQWVSSGQMTEHRARRRLIGGRVYPLQLHLFRFKDKTNSVALLWRAPTFVVTTPFPPDDSSVGYERGVLVSKAWDEAATQAAIEVANHVVTRLDRLTRTKPEATNRLEQVETFCAEFVTAAFRRPLTAEQRALHVTDQFKRAKSIEDAVKRVVLLALKSPRFLYLGLADAPPDDFEIAARLSFGLWDSLPDRELMRLAAKGELRTREPVAAQARRMLGDPRARAKALAFLHHWLQMDRVESLAKDDQVFPGFTPEIIADLRASLDVFLEDTFWHGPADYRKLLTADYLFVNNRLARFYGFPTNANDDFVRVQPGDGQRSGVLTHPYLLAAFSYARQTSPIHRGVFLTRNIVGRALKPPPMAVAFKDAEFAPNLTMREKVTELTRPENCMSCHSVINPLGFSLEHYDAVGRFRTRERDRPIDATGEFQTGDGETIRLTGAPDIARFALDDAQAQSAFIEQMFHQVVKQPVLAYGPGVMPRLRQGFAASGFNLQELLVEIAVTAALHHPEPAPTRKGKP
jgi:mono/diheme cytochrome c family protein